MIQAPKSEVEKKLRGKAIAYGQVFDPKNQFVQEVLKDLAKFCRAHQSTFNIDPRLAANLDGRREVWLRIQNYLQLEITEIYKLHNIKE